MSENEHFKPPPFLASGDPGPAFKAMAFQLSSVGFAISARFKACLEPFDIEPRQFALLRAVGFASGQSQKALAESLKVPTSSMVATIDDLEARGFIERRPMADDRRVRALHLTKKGEELLGDVLPVAMKIEQTVRDAVQDDGQVFEQVLQRIATAFNIVPGAAHASVADKEAHTAN